MKVNKKYYSGQEISPIKFENIEEKQLIHQFENKSIQLNLDKLQDRKKVNEIR